MSAEDRAADVSEEEVESDSTILEKSVLYPFAQFYKDCEDLVTRSQKPDSREYFSILWATSIGMIVMGGIAYAVKLAHYPVKEILIGSGGIGGK